MIGVNRQTRMFWTKGGQDMNRKKTRRMWIVFGGLVLLWGIYSIGMVWVLEQYSDVVFKHILILGSGPLLTALLMIFLYLMIRCQKKKQIGICEYDLLTGLLTVSGLENVLPGFIKKTKKLPICMVSLDLVDFRRFNIMFGYHTGNSLLKAIGQTITERYHCGARVGGDVFIFAVELSENTAFEVKQVLNQGIEKLLGKNYLQTVSYKLGLYPVVNADQSYRSIFDGTSLALKEAKRSAKYFCVYDQVLQQKTELQKNIEINMLQALSEDEFKVYIQPQFQADNKRCCGGECLIRWKSDILGFLLPDIFIPVFEENGFIMEIDIYMLTQAMELTKRRIADGGTPYKLAVNQSRVTLAFPNYLERLNMLVCQYSIPLDLIEIEITESALVDDYEVMVTVIREIKRLGFTVAMDDFGSGYSSLNTLCELPVDVLKIDKEFLRESDTNERNKIIIKNIIQMSKELNIKVVCEGVETLEQYEFLKDVGCDIVQGYYFARPMPSDEFHNQHIWYKSAV